jgi:hypothetical protein
MLTKWSTASRFCLAVLFPARLLPLIPFLVHSGHCTGESLVYCPRWSCAHNARSSFCPIHASEQRSGPMPASEPPSSASFTVPLPDLTTSTSPPQTTGMLDERFVTDTSKVFFTAVLATNSISLAACLFVITAYFFLHRKYPQVMSRTSLKLSVAMACSDTIYHVWCIQ